MQGVSSSVGKRIYPSRGSHSTICQTLFPLCYEKGSGALREESRLHIEIRVKHFYCLLRNMLLH